MNSIEIIRYLENKFPPETAYDWDNSGLQVGTLNSKASKVLISLDVTKEVVKEAIQNKVDLIISHHPLMFKAMQNIVFDSPKGWMIKNLIKHNISVYSAHTNFDQGDGGMNDVLAEKIGIKDATLMDEVDNIGRFGKIEPTPFRDFAYHIKKVFNLANIKVVGRDDRLIKMVGVSGGSGSHHMYAAKRKNCDVYITGDVTYHTALDAEQLGITIIDVGHHIEIVFVEAMIKILKKEFSEVDFIASKIDTNPYKDY